MTPMRLDLAEDLTDLSEPAFPSASRRYAQAGGVVVLLRWAGIGCGKKRPTELPSNRVAPGNSIDRLPPSLASRQADFS
jgi:hypothetical protein